MIQKNSVADLQVKLTLIPEICNAWSSCLLGKKSYFKRRIIEYTP